MSAHQTGQPDSAAVVLGDGVVLRPGRVEDAEAIAALIVRENCRPADVAGIAQDLAAGLSTLALRDGAPVGFILTRPFAPDVLEWRNTLVVAAERRCGLGRALALRTEATSRDAGYLALIGVNCWKRQGATMERASAARHFWRAMGWTIIFATGGSVVLAKRL